MLDKIGDVANFGTTCPEVGIIRTKELYVPTCLVCYATLSGEDLKIYILRCVMSMDLSFWKYKENIYLDNQDVYKKLSNGSYIDGLEKLPIPQILKDIEIAFGGWDKQSGYGYESKNGTFQIFTTEQFIRFDCYSVAQDDMNKIIDLLFEYGCPLYDSQISERFDGWG